MTTLVGHLKSMVDLRLDGAACKGRAPLWDSRQSGETVAGYSDRARKAARICAQCPVKQACAVVAVEIPRSRRTGIWVGIDHEADLEGTAK